MSGSLSQALAPVPVKNLDDAGRAVAFSAEVTLVANQTFTLNLRQQSGVYPKQIQGAYVDNSAGTAACVITTLAGDSKSIPSGYQGTMPLYLGPDDTLYMSGAGSVRLTLLNFQTPMAVWSALGSSSTVAQGYGPSDEVVAERVRNTSVCGGLSSGYVSIFSAECYIDAFDLKLSADATISSGGLLGWKLGYASSNPQYLVQNTNNTSNNGTIAFSNAPAAGNVIFAYGYSNNDNNITAPSGWTGLGSTHGTPNNSILACWTRTVQQGDSGTYTGFTSGGNYNLVAFEVTGTPTLVQSAIGNAASVTGDVVDVTLPSAPSGDALRLVILWDSALLTPGTYSSGLTQLVTQNANIGDTIACSCPVTQSTPAVFTLGNSPSSTPGAMVIDIKATPPVTPILEGNVYVPGTAPVSSGVVTLSHFENMKLTVPSSSGVVLDITSGTLSAGQLFYTALGGLTSAN